MDKVFAHKLLAVLRNIEDLLEYNDNKSGGICSIVSPLFWSDPTVRGEWNRKSKVVRTFKRWMEEWPEGSGNADYPVPCPASINAVTLDAGSYSMAYGCSAEIIFDSSVDKWSGDYGNARRRLVTYLALKCQEVIDGK